MEQKNFGDAFIEAVDGIIRDAKEIGVPMSEICSDASVSRATPSRWKRNQPSTIETVVKLQGAVAARRAAKVGA